MKHLSSNAGSPSRRSILTVLCLMVALAAISAFAAPSSLAPQVTWERYVSTNSVFTLQKPVGWLVKESLDAKAGIWSCTVREAKTGWQATINHGRSPTGRDVNARANEILLSMRKTAPSLRLAPTVKVRDAGKKRLLVFEGTFSAPNLQKMKFRGMVSGGDGLMLHENIEAPADQFDKAAPVLLQTLASLRVANLFPPGDSSGPTPRQAEPLVPKQLASGWAKYSAPQGWQALDLGKGACIVTDPEKQLVFIVGGAEFVTPRYYVPQVKGVLCSAMLSPHEALAYSTTKAGLGSNFRSVFVKPRQDLAQIARGFSGPLRPVAVEDFAYTFDNKEGTPYTGFSCGGCSGDAMGASWRLWHFTIMAPTRQFEAVLPTLAAVMGSYELNGQMAGREMANNLANYYAGLRHLSQQLAMNSEQMRRENLQVMLNNDRVRDYTSYQTTRMIMGDYQYLAGASGYVVANPDGLYTPDGQVITREPYGESLTRNLQEINSLELFEQVFRATP